MNSRTYRFRPPNFSPARIPVYPPPKALEVAQDRVTEKRFIKDCGIPTAGFHAVDNQAELEAALADFDGKGVLKTRRLGYDGKGQKVFEGPQDLPAGALQRTGRRYR